MVITITIIITLCYYYIMNVPVRTGETSREVLLAVAASCGPEDLRLTIHNDNNNKTSYIYIYIWREIITNQ